MKLPQIAAPLDFIDFLRVASIKAVQHMKKAGFSPCFFHGQNGWVRKVASSRSPSLPIKKTPTSGVFFIGGDGEI